MSQWLSSLYYMIFLDKFAGWTYLVVYWLCKLDFGRQVGHRIVDKLLAQLRQLVFLYVIKGGLHYTRNATASPTTLFFSEIALVVRFTMLPNNTPRTQIT